MKTKTTSDREKALTKLFNLRHHGSPCKQWRNVGYFDVPGTIMAALHAEGLCEMRKKTGSSPTEYRP